MESKNLTIFILSLLLLNITKYSCAYEKPKILIAGTTVPENGLKVLKRKCELIKIDDETKQGILSNVKGVHAIFWNTETNLDKDILEEAGEQLIVVGITSETYNQIDIIELKKRGIKLSNSYGEDDESKSTLTALNILRALGGEEMFTPVEL